MGSVYILIPISIIIVFVIVYFLWWSTKNGQFDDLKGPGFRIIMDDDDTEHLVSKNGKQKDKQKNHSNSNESS